MDITSTWSSSWLSSFFLSFNFTEWISLIYRAKKNTKNWVWRNRIKYLIKTEREAAKRISLIIFRDVKRPELLGRILKLRLNEFELMKNEKEVTSFKSQPHQTTALKYIERKMSRAERKSSRKDNETLHI